MAADHQARGSRTAASTSAALALTVIWVEKLSVIRRPPGRGSDGHELGLGMLERLGGAFIPACGECRGHRVGEDVLGTCGNTVEDRDGDILGGTLRSVEVARHVGVDGTGEHRVDA